MPWIPLLLLGASPLLSAWTSGRPQTLIFHGDWKPRGMVAQAGIRDGFASPLSHPRLGKLNHSNAIITPFLNSPIALGKGEAHIQRYHQQQCKTHHVGESGSSPQAGTMPAPIPGSACARGMIPRASLKHLSSVK